MDIQRKAFEAWLKSLNENGRTTYFLGQESTVAWETWQAKAQAVPEGFVLVPIKPSEDVIDKLASVICDEFDTTISGSAHCASEAYRTMVGESK